MRIGLHDLKSILIDLQMLTIPTLALPKTLRYFLYFSGWYAMTRAYNVYPNRRWRECIVRMSFRNQLAVIVFSSNSKFVAQQWLCLIWLQLHCIKVINCFFHEFHLSLVGVYIYKLYDIYGSLYCAKFEVPRARRLAQHLYLVRGW